MAAGLSLEDSVQVANTAASLVVEQVGTTSGSIEKLERKLEEQRTNGSELAITSL
jgi:bifunctional ADP-heptose synthase (sugar kinase/adenylyltransferase)